MPTTADLAHGGAPFTEANDPLDATQPLMAIPDDACARQRAWDGRRVGDVGADVMSGLPSPGSGPPGLGFRRGRRELDHPRTACSRYPYTTPSWGPSAGSGKLGTPRVGQADVDVVGTVPGQRLVRADGVVVDPEALGVIVCWLALLRTGWPARGTTRLVRMTCAVLHIVG